MERRQRKFNGSGEKREVKWERKIEDLSGNTYEKKRNYFRNGRNVKQRRSWNLARKRGGNKTK